VNAQRVVIAGGGAAGFFGAITCAEAKPNADITILEKSSQFLSKVRISGGGRCNVTHACFDARDFATRFPRGEQPLIGPFQRFQARDTVKWFEARGVKLKTESDGRMFPVTDSSETIIDCLVDSAKASGVRLVTNCGVQRLSKRAEGGFEVTLSTGKSDECDRVLLATGGCRTATAGQLAVSLGHTLEPPVPSLFTFHTATPWLHKLAGISVDSAETSIPGTGLRERGAVLVTHSGLSGPAILRLSAWGARELHDRDYQFPLHVNWLPQLDAEQVASELNERREQHPAKLVVNTPIAPLPARLWEQLVLASGIVEDTRWSRLTRAAQHRLIQQLTRTELAVTGKSLNKDEFVTCGGVRLREVDFKTMESRICKGLYFAGELLDIDGITGGFNFQAAWTTGWIAGRSMSTIRP
jgi:predicted Rossmann fold flavoprotein